MRFGSHIMNVSLSEVIAHASGTVQNQIHLFSKIRNNYNTGKRTNSHHDNWISMRPGNYTVASII